MKIHPAILTVLLLGSNGAAVRAQPADAVGQLLSFVSVGLGLDDEGFGGIWVGRADGTGFKQLTSFRNPFYELDSLHGLQLPEDHPAISPDGRKMAFISNRGHVLNKEIYVMDINGANRRRLTFSDGLDTEASWSPDSRRIVFSTARYGNMDLAILDLLTQEVTQLTDSPEEEVEPAWSPAGDRIAYTRAFGFNRKQIRSIRPDGTDDRLIFDTDGEDHDATWDPTGTRVTFTSERDGTIPYGDVFVVNANGTGLVNLTADMTFGGGDPSWSPDGTKIAFFHTFLPLMRSPQHVFVMNADGSSRYQVEDRGLVNVHPNFGWMLDSDRDGRPDYLESSNTHHAAETFGVEQTGGFFGHAVAVGELSGSPLLPTLAVGAPGLGGRVVLRHVAADGIFFNVPVKAYGEVLPATGVTSEFWGVPGSAVGRFGQTLAAGDFDGDGARELVVGAPGLGRVFILNHRTATKRHLNGGVVEFGSALAVGDFNRDGFDDLAVGSPRAAPAGIAGAGVVRVYLGSSAGLTEGNSVVLDQGTMGVGDVGGIESSDNFGAAVAAGDVTGDAADDLIVGAPGEGYGGVAGAGVVHVIPGLTGGAFQRAQSQIRDARSVPSPFTGAQAGARFGEALAVGRFGGVALAKLDLAVGVPLQNIGTVADAGMVTVYGSSLTGLPATATLAFCVTNLPGGLGLTSMRLGQTLAVGDFSGDGVADLAVSAPRQNAIASQAGAVYLIHGARPASTATTTTTCSLCVPLPTSPLIPLSGGGLHLPGAQRIVLGQCGALAGANDHLGGNAQLAAPDALAAFDLDFDGQSDLMIGVAEADASEAVDSGLVAIRYGVRVGTFELRPAGGTVEPGEPWNVELEWTHPGVWSELESVHLRLASDDGVFFWLRFDEASRTVQLYDGGTGQFGEGFSLGEPGLLENDWFTLDLGQSVLVTSGPEGSSVTLALALTPRIAAGCRVLQAQLFATDDHGNAQGYETAGTLVVGDCTPQVGERFMEFRFPAEVGYRYTVEVLMDPPGDRWLSRRTYIGDDTLQTYRAPVREAKATHRLRVEPR